MARLSLEMRAEMSRDPFNILIIKPGAMGDLLHLTPAIRALKESFPQARISILVGSRMSASLFEKNQLVHDTVIYDKRGEHRSLSGLLKLWKELRIRRFDLIINYQRSNLKGWFLASAAFPCRVLVYHKARKRSVHAVVNHLETLAPLGITPGDIHLEFNTGPEAESFAESLFTAAGLKDRIVIALNPGASHPVNRWETRYFAALADLVCERLGARIVLVGGKEDQGLANEVAAMAHGQPRVLTGATDLLQLAAVLKRCSILVSGDTGPMHMATAVGTNVVALFGAADPDRTGPVGTCHRIVQATNVLCVPCRSRACSNDRYLECMKQITPEQVYAEIVSILQTKGVLF